MKNLVIHLIILFSFLLIIVSMQQSDDIPEPTIPVATTPTPAASDNSELGKLREYLTDEDYDAALPVIAYLLSEGTAGKERQAWLYQQQAWIQTQWMHYHSAIDSLTLANSLVEANYNEQQIDRLQTKIDSEQSERDYTDVYEDSRDSGITKTLQKKITIAYIYLDDNRWSKWSPRLRQRNRNSMDGVVNWYHQQSGNYDIDDLEVDVRYFYVKSPKGISKEWIRQRDFFIYAQGLLVKQLGFRTTKQFIASLTGGSSNHQVALVFHSNNDERSFAMSCPKEYQRSCNLEYVMLTEKMNNNPYGWVIQQVQAHEILHLFGADDLYPITSAKDYAVTDVMNYYSDALKHATIDPITAWSIGWTDLPNTPFRVDLIED
ncbi:MAG: hypothetical protein COA90_10150 [Gammaproteobacteria bacterium]|nr:MAG: hypothetical protein COA90_10150 [Gammaproteobacteria bacterium]